MQEEIFSNISQYGKTAMDSTKELVAINSRLMSKLLDSQMKLARICLESSEKEMSVVAQAQDPKVFMEAQNALLEECSTLMQKEAEETAKVMQETGEELKAWFEKGIQTADEAMKEVAQATEAAAPAAVKKAKAPVAAKKAPAKKAPAKKKAATKKAAA